MTPVRRRLRALAGATLVVATVLPLTAAPAAAAGTVSLTALGTAYTQDFDTLASSGTSNTAVPTGWEFSESGTNANTTYRAGTGSDNTGDTYSFGAASSTDRAFGGLRSGSLVPLIGAQLTNGTGSTIASLDVAYTGEQWRLGQNTTGRAADRLDFQYSTDATSLTTGTWTDVNALDFASPVVSGTVGSLTGNVSPNRTAISASVTGLSVANGTTLWIRWADTDLIPGADDGLSVDDLSITPRGAAPLPALSINDVTAAEGNAGTTSFDFTVSLGAPAGTGGVTFDIATADDTATTAGNDYVAKSTTGATIAAGASSTTFSVTVNGDPTPESSETFRVNVTNVSGATVADGQGTGTITNDDADPAPTVASSVPADGATNVPRTQTLSVTFSEPVTVTAPWYGLECTTSGTVATTYAGGPTTFTIDPSTDLAYGESCTLTIVASAVSDQDGIDPPDSMTFNFTVGFSTELDPCTLAYTSIASIQGSGATTPLNGVQLSTKGVVVGDFEGPTPALRGFFIQDPDGDANPATSEGLFVFEGNNANTVSVGDVVRVTGTANENGGQTQVSAGTIVKCGTGTITPTDVTLPVASADAFERYEGMLVRFPQPLVISEYFNYDRFGEIVLAQPLSGETRPYTGTAVDSPGAAANARTAANALSRITLDDANTSQNPAVLRHPNGQPFSLANRFRGGDTVQNAVGVLGFGFSLYRIYPTGPADYTAANPRPAAPADPGGSLRVAAMNTLNFFVTGDEPGGPLDNRCGPAQNVECRGWDTDQATEFTRQRDKLLQALTGLDAAVIGLNELENTAGVEPLESIASGMPGYDYIHTGTIGTDAIKVGLIYRTADVTPVGAYALLTSAVDPRFLDGKNRPSLAQTFEVNATGERFTVVVNHLKSKGSDCVDVGDPDLGDGQGNCSQVRLAAAQALVDWIATDPTGSGDPDVLIMGDLNSYAMEQSVTAIKRGSDDQPGTGDDFTNLIAAYQGTYAYSYTFDGQAGYLDHALSSASITGQVTGAVDWHINSDEPDVLDYDTSFKPAAQDALYEVNAYRTSDHDPVVVGLELGVAPVVSTPVVTPEPSVEGQSVVATAAFTDNDASPETCTVDYGDGSGQLAGSVSGSTCTGPAHVYTTYGGYTVTVRVTDDDGTGSATTAHDVNFAFTGFFQPVDMTGANQVKAGAAVPFKFSLGGDKGTAVLAAGSPTSVRVTCDTNTTIDPIEETVTSGASGLRYDATTGTYVYTWKTQKTWAATCRMVTFELVDGTKHTALFTFTK